MSQVKFKNHDDPSWTFEKISKKVQKWLKIDFREQNLV
jgi:hypothetical protein